MVLPKTLVVCCDGTWCGPVTGTDTNIKILAECFGGKQCSSDPTGFTNFNQDTNTKVRYLQGEGVAGDFLEYLADGALALRIRDRCVEAYDFLVEEFEAGCKIWLFGLSRGAHTIRCVAGMINNCGILDQRKLASCANSEQFAKDRRTACEIVYSIYSSRDPMYAPQEDFAKRFRATKSHDTKEPPVKFMGLLDTVGSLGVPKLEGSPTFSYEFYDQSVSREVENVYQALALHDRLSVFEPCFARRKKLDKGENAKSTRYPDSKFTTEEVWFPGAHYDIGRQKFIFARKAGRLEALLRRFVERLNPFDINIDCDYKLSDKPLLWMVGKIQQVSAASGTQLLPKPAAAYLPKHEEDAKPSLLLQIGGHIPRTASFLWSSLLGYAMAKANVTTDAYEGIFNSIGMLGLISPVLPILKPLLLRDRCIPLYLAEGEGPKFYSTEQCTGDFTDCPGFPTSRCFYNWKLLAGPGRVIFVPEEASAGAGAVITATKI